MTKPVILTGLRANNDLHIGNFLGALLPLVHMAQKKAGEYQVNIFVPDLHSFTTPIEHSVLYDQTLHNLKLYVASGLPLDKSEIYIYRQSYIPAHSELTWILDCFTGFGEMGRMTQFKDKSSKLADDRISVGLFNYPVLMAADILLYDALYVPVGDDQSQHLEFARDIAERFNNRFGNIFTVPKPVKEQNAFFDRERGLRIKDLVDPDKKMSKSDETGKGVVFLSDTPESARKKIMSATTDSLARIRFDPREQPGISNLITILALYTDKSIDEVLKEYEGKTQYGPLKQAVADAVCAFLRVFQSKLAAVDEHIIIQKLEHDEAVMREIAGAKLQAVQRVVGLRR